MIKWIALSIVLLIVNLAALFPTFWLLDYMDNSHWSHVPALGCLVVGHMLLIGCFILAAAYAMLAHDEWKEKGGE